MKKINRNTFLRNAALGSLGIGMASHACASDASQNSEENPRSNKRYRWNMVTTWPPGFPIIGEGCEHFADWVRTMSGGRLDIKVYGGGELIPALESFDAVSSGTVEMAHGCAYYWAGKIPAAQFFGSVPFGMNSQQMNAWIIGGGGLKLWQEIYEPFNVIPFPAGQTNVQMGGWFNKEI
ncbi:MAG: ABC transporter substrate-binding protein, partial [Saprospiraceae bacterium]|nr:ABC transporter substrate-binding protein [Saprospiraceae bacterium]